VTVKHPSIYDDFRLDHGRRTPALGQRRRIRARRRGLGSRHTATTATTRPGVTYADQVLARAIGWSQHGFCINCGVDTTLIEAVHAAYGAPVLAALTKASAAQVNRRP